jgi:hypothetical protein
MTDEAVKEQVRAVRKQILERVSDDLERLARLTTSGSVADVSLVDRGDGSAPGAR